MYHYVISDLHGDLEGFHKILEKINLQKEDQLYILGDVIDRGPDSIPLLKEIMKMSNTKMLLGNHEYMMLQGLGQSYESVHGYEQKDFDIYKCQSLWFRNGGGITFDQFCKESIETKGEILNYIISLPLNINVTVDDHSYLLCHAAPADESAFYRYADFEESIPEFAVWNREWAVRESIPGTTVITGHTPTGNMDGWMCHVYQYPGGVLDIDTGAAYPQYGGRVSCTRLEDLLTIYND